MNNKDKIKTLLEKALDENGAYTVNRMAIYQALALLTACPTWKIRRLGKVKAIVDRTYPLSEVADAHRYIDSRAVRGKVVLLP